MPSLNKLFPNCDRPAKVTAKKKPKRVGTVETCLILPFHKLPQPVQDAISLWPGCSDNCTIDVSRHSVFSAKDYARGMAAVEDYYGEQAANGFQGDLRSFIRAFDLLLDVWIIEQGFELDKIDRILVEVSKYGIDRPEP